jgi:hypothetical protein
MIVVLNTLNKTATTTRDGVRGMIEVVSGKLYLAREDVLGKSELKSATVVIDLSSGSKHVSDSWEGSVYLRWNIGEDVEEKMFEALIRMVSGVMKAPKQTIALVGHHDTIDVVAACVLREYLGCKPEIAISILREARPKCLNKPDLISTVGNYRIS